MKSETCEGNEFILFAVLFRMVLGTSHPFIQSILGALSCSEVGGA
jgi:hypothetical protein